MSTRILLGASGVMLLASGGLIGGYFVSSSNAAEVAPVPSPSEPRVATPKGTADLAEFLAGSVTLTLGDNSTTVGWAEVGITGTKLDRAQAMDYLTALNNELAVAPHDAWLNLEGRRLEPEQPGTGIDVFGAFAALETAIAERSTAVQLPAADIPPEVTAEDFHNIDISQVMGTFTTKFSVAEKSRNHNLKLAASKLNGLILQPGQEFSFNETVGSREAEDGYKIAHVITAGEMVDGLAGGTCQISTTLHGASFFAGLEIVKSTPHSRPSTYVTMGLDATVVYPVTDLKMRNPYEFPIVVHYKVARGESTVEILGPGRPYDEVAFERHVEEELPFETVTREDNTLPVGTMVIEQEGFPGYKMKRLRKYYRDGKVAKTDTWNLRYRPVTEYIRTGTNPDPNLPPPKAKKGHSPHAPKTKVFRMTQ